MIQSKRVVRVSVFMELNGPQNVDYKREDFLRAS